MSVTVVSRLLLGPGAARGYAGCAAKPATRKPVAQRTLTRWDVGMPLHEGETPVPHHLVADLVRQQCPWWAGLPLRRLRTSGTEHTTWRLGEDFLVRLPRHADAAQGLLKEITWWPRLRAVIPLEVPEVLHVGTPTEHFRHPWAVNRWLPGQDAAGAALTGPIPLSWATVLAEVVQALSSVDLTRLAPEQWPVGARGGHLQERIRGLDEARDWLSTRPEAVPFHTMLASAAAVEPPPITVVLHADLIPGNLVIRDGQIVGLLDLGTLTTGYPAWEHTCAWWVLDAPTRARYRAILEVDEASWQWGRAFAALQGNAARWYYESKGHPLAALGARALDQCLQDVP